MQSIQIETRLLEAWRRLAGKGFLNSPADSFSLRVPGKMEMILASGLADWRRIGIADLRTASLFSKEGLCGLHASIYRERTDAGAVTISSPKGARLLARFGGLLPPIFDEQVRHIGSNASPLPDEESVHGNMVRKTFKRGANAALLGERLLCLGMTCDRVLFNTELYEKCAQAYVIARASGNQIGFIPVWVRLIANHRLLRDERRAAGRYRNGCIPDSINTY
jgi:ribulose-5-phosphate 4-epimerase/fuculose-1-phosphate aldolase